MGSQDKKQLTQPEVIVAPREVMEHALCGVLRGFATLATQLRRPGSYLNHGNVLRSNQLATLVQ